MTGGARSPDRPPVRLLFEQFNSRQFGNRLPRYRVRRQWDPKYRALGWCYPPDRLITVHPNLIEDGLEAVLLHRPPSGSVTRRAPRARSRFDASLDWRPVAAYISPVVILPSSYTLGSPSGSAVLRFSTICTAGRRTWGVKAGEVIEIAGLITLALGGAECSASFQVRRAFTAGREVCLGLPRDHGLEDAPGSDTWVVERSVAAASSSSSRAGIPYRAQQIHVIQAWWHQPDPPAHPIYIRSPMAPQLLG